jgi:hypothetical protein
VRAPRFAALQDFAERPAEWYAKGVRILARTALEAVRDPLGDRIGRDVARVGATALPGSAFGVVDPFAGSWNGLYSILRHLPGVEGIGFEAEPTIFEMSACNIASLGAPIRLRQGDYSAQVGQHRFRRSTASCRSWPHPGRTR